MIIYVEKFRDTFNFVDAFFQTRKPNYFYNNTYCY